MAYHPGKAAKIAAPHDQPHLAAVPDRADGVDRDPLFEICAAHGVVQDADAEVEPLEDEEPGPKGGDDDEPEDVKTHDVTSVG